MQIYFQIWYNSKLTTFGLFSAPAERYVNNQVNWLLCQKLYTLSEKHPLPEAFSNQPSAVSHQDGDCVVFQLLVLSFQFSVTLRFGC